MGKKVKKALNIATFGLSSALIPETPKTPEITGSAQPAATPGATPTAVSDETLEVREAQRRRQLAAAGLSGTNLTGGGLASAANTGAKTLLGS